jgi:hypothetical protein
MAQKYLASYQTMVNVTRAANNDCRYNYPQNSGIVSNMDMLVVVIFMHLVLLFIPDHRTTHT